jgi:hypothetical protein
MLAFMIEFSFPASFHRVKVRGNTTVHDMYISWCSTMSVDERRLHPSAGKCRSPSPPIQTCPVAKRLRDKWPFFYTSMEDGILSPLTWTPCHILESNGGLRVYSPTCAAFMWVLSPSGVSVVQYTLSFQTPIVSGKRQWKQININKMNLSKVIFNIITGILKHGNFAIIFMLRFVT